jgi:hypothetical protein
MHHAKGVVMTRKYKYDHIAKRLINEHAWIRVPWFVPLQETKKEYGPDLIAKINELEERIKSK